MIASLLDTILDRTVVAGHTSAGHRIRSRAWDAGDPPSMDGKTVLVTGATSGLGLAAAEGFARLGASIRLLARSEERGERAFLLTNLLVPLLTESAPARVINVSSGGMYTRRLHVEDLQSTGETLSWLPRFHRLTGPLLRSPHQGADTIVWLGAAAEPGGSSGGFWHDRRRRRTHRVPWTRETPDDREKLWHECERLTGWHEGPLPAPAHART